jgi:hypothetical protein
MRIAVITLLWAIVFSAAACTQEAGALSKDVGAACEGDADCNFPESYCQEGNLFPDGMCSIECESQGDCIASTVCSEDGVCLMRCFADSDCRKGYSCLDQKRIAGGEEPVCSNDPPL